MVEAGVVEPHLCYLALGSNLGDRDAHLLAALIALPTIFAKSGVYETAPIGGPDGQGAYLNMVVSIETDLDPYALLRRCQTIEASRRRERHVHWGPRTLDIDVLFYDSITIDDPTLTIPHPLINERRFVLAPLAEIAPHLCPPGWETDLPPDPVNRVGSISI